MRRRKIFCICFAFCLWISGFIAVSADDGFETDKSYIKNFTCTNNIGNTKIELNVSADVWSDGPYAQINKIMGNYTINIWSPREVYPTAKLFYAYNGTLKVKVTNVTPTSVIEELEREGFCGAEPILGITHYIKRIDECGEIRLYQ